MTLEDLPNELLLSIADHLNVQRDLNAFARSSRRLHSHVNNFLYQRNARTGRTSALLWAVERRREATAIRALDAGIDANTRGSFWDKPAALHVACAKGYLNIVNLLLSRGASTHATTTKGLTPLHVACYFRQAPIVETLLNHGADVGARDIERQTPLHCAAQTPNRGGAFQSMFPRKFQWVCYLLVYKPGERIWGDNVATVELLLARNADPTLADRVGQSPESIAKYHYDPEVRALIRKAAISARLRAGVVDPKTKEKTRLAREKAREAGRLAREQQKQAIKAREEAEARQRAKEAREREQARGLKEQEEKEARERQAERAREHRLQSLRRGWAQLRKTGERHGSQEEQDTKGKASASATCSHSSSVWARKGKGLCEVCLKSCAKYSFQCPDCGTVACGVCKTRFCLI
jgi:hypothetical protein